MDQPEMLIVSKNRGSVSGRYSSDPDVVCRKGRTGLAERNHDFRVDAGRIIIHVEDFNQRMMQESTEFILVFCSLAAHEKSGSEFPQDYGRNSNPPGGSNDIDNR